MHVGESKYPQPLITLVAVLVAALALSAIIWAETGWPWRSDAYEIGEGTEEAETSSYIEYNGELVFLASSEYGGEAAHNLFTFAMTPNFLVFPEGERYRYEIKPGEVIAWNGLPLEALTRLNPDGGRASLYVDEYTPMVLLYHLMPQFLGAGFSGVDFILGGSEGELEWRVNTTSDLIAAGTYNNPHCLYWDRRVIQLGTSTDIVEETSAEEYLFLTKDEFSGIIGTGAGTVILLPGANTTFGELICARDALWEKGNKQPALAVGFDDSTIAPFMNVLSVNPGYWEYNIQPTGNFPPRTPSNN
jgi:hypothetical protein